MNKNKIIVYKNGEVEIKVSIDNQNETLWANIKEIAQLFNIDRSVVSRHIKNIFKDGELDENVVCANFAYTTQHGALNNKTQTKMVKYYNLDIILAVGYRTNSKKAIEFRRWVTKILKQYIINGYAINSEKITVDRFLLIDNKEAYHIGANLKDLGRRIFASSKIDIDLIKKAVI